MEEVIMMIPLMVIVGFLGIAIGMYISSQIKFHIRSNINRKELLKNINEEEKIKQ